MKKYFKRNWDLIMGNFLYAPLFLIILLSLVGLQKSGLLFWVLAWSFLIAFFIAPIFLVIAIIRSIINKQLRRSVWRWIIIAINVLLSIGTIILIAGISSGLSGGFNL